MSNGRGKQNRNSEIEDIISKINKIDKLKDIKVKNIAKENGCADKIARVLSKDKNFKTTQLRKFFAAIREIQLNEDWNKIEPKLYLLLPQLANSVGRKLIPREFYDLMKVCIVKVDSGSHEDKLKNFERMVQLFESIVAYHKFYNPRA